MKTALEILFETTNGDADYISVSNCLEAMKRYAKQVAEQALKDAAERLNKELEDFEGLRPEFIIIITKTPIIIP